MTKETKEKHLQRIKLRIEGSPVKWDGTVLESSPDGKQITVEFDGPLETKVLYSGGGSLMFSDMYGMDGEPVTEYRLAVKSLVWEVL